MREIVKLGIILLVISAVAAAVLGYTNEITKEPIEQQVLQANIEARQSILSEATDFEEISKEQFAEYTEILEVYRGIKNGETVGFTVKTNPSGYGGEIEVMIGIKLDGTISGINIGNHSETPGLGAKASEEFFKNQYIGKKSDKELTVIKSGVPKDNEIQAISGATITSKAVTSGVNTAIKFFNEKLNK
jgi:electron transport complex protein RnfG